MENTSLLVPAVDNYLDNIYALLEGSVMASDETDIVGQFIQDQMSKILENAELYYLEKAAKNKREVFIMEFTHYLYCLILQNNSQVTSIYLSIPKKYREKKVELDIETLKRMEKIINYLIMMNDDIKNVELNEIEDEIRIKINFKKNKEQGLQIK